MISLVLKGRLLMEPITGLLLMALGAMVAVAVLKWEDIRSWMDSKKTISYNIGTVIKTELSSGRVAVCSGVFNANGKASAVIAWKPNQVDAEINNKLKLDDMIEIQL
jgi:hypothetical protein